MEVILLDGETGMVEELVPVPGVPSDFYGIYGAASDADGNFWGSQLGQGYLVRVDRETFEVDSYPMPLSGYGMTVDANGRVWTCSYGAARFDPASETWETNNAAGGQAGCMSDSQGRLWMASNPLVALDIDTLQVVASINLPSYVHGVSVDFFGYVWGVATTNSAYRVDPATGDYETVTGLNSPYTYSDMTGWALSNVVGPAPSG
jgi:streptogramin lyase